MIPAHFLSGSNEALKAKADRQAQRHKNRSKKKRTASRAIHSNWSSTSTYRLPRKEKCLVSEYLPLNVPASRGAEQKTYLHCRVFRSSVDSMKQNIFHVKDLASSSATWLLTRKHLFHKGKTYSDLTEIFSKIHFI